VTADREPGAVVAWLDELGCCISEVNARLDGKNTTGLKPLVLATDYEASQRQLAYLTQANIAIQRSYDDAEQRCEAMRARAEAAEAAGQPGVDAERREDMSPRGRLRLHAQDDGDMCVMVIEDDGTSAGIEFCNSGGHSPRTLQALRNLSRAMQDDAIDEQERGG
jgi:hypothetical protein